MVCHGNGGKQAGKRYVRTLSSICLRLVDGSLCRNIPAKYANTGHSYVIYRTDDLNSCGSETERPGCFWMHMIIGRNCILTIKNDGKNLNQNDCGPNDCWNISKVSVNIVSTILV
jgi:hypothetical protein